MWRGGRYVRYANDQHPQLIADSIRMLGDAASNEPFTAMRYSAEISREDPPARRAALEVQNLGRSPAVNVQLAFVLTVTRPVVQRDRDPAAGKTYSHKSIEVTLRIQTLPPRDIAHVIIESALRDDLTIAVQSRAQVLNYWSPKRDMMGVAAIGTPILLLGPLYRPPAPGVHSAPQNL
jgi:hypothetical protein